MSQDLAWRNLLKEQSWMQEAMDAANTGLWVIMIDTRNGCCSMLASAPMLRLLGLEEHPAPEECFAFWRGRVDKKCDDDVNDVVDQFLADTQLHEVRYPYHHPKWGVIFVRCGGRRISADDDPLVRITGYHQDVSEIQAMHQSLRESLARLSLACRLGQLGVFELRHGEGDLELTGNDIFFGQLGLPEGLGDEERVDAVEARLVPEDREAWRALRHPEDWVVGRHEHTEVRVLHPRLGQRWLKLAYEVMGSGENRRIAGYTDDVTERRLHERMLREAKDEAEAANAAKSIFLANMSHEIRTPLNAIVGFSKLVADADSPEEKQLFADIIDSNSELLLQLINDILDISKIEAGTLEFNFRTMDLGLLCQEQYEIHKTRVREGVRLVLDDHAGSVELFGDHNRLAQVYTNLIGNAIKFTHQGEIRFGYRVEGDRIVGYVSDTGVGIPADKVGAVFDRFIKLNDFAAGTGLGLSITKMIIEKMGGGIEVSSREGEGTTFRFTIPYSRLDTEGPGKAADGARRHAQRATEAVEGKRILVAEDIDSNFMLIDALIGRRFDLLRARNGEEAVALFGRERPDLVLMDLKMPVMDGYEATRLIRAEAPTAPLVVMSAFAYEGDIERAYEAGCTDYVTKPVSRKRLMEVIERYLG